MKRLLLLPLCLLLIAIACNKNEEPTFVPELSVSATMLPFSADSTSQSVTITSNTSWAVTSDNAWCSVSPASGQNDGKLLVSVKQNTELNSRSAKITITAKDKEPVIVDVIQLGTAPVLTLTQTVYEVGDTASVLEIEVTTNLTEITSTIPADCNWIHLKNIVQKSTVVKIVSFNIDQTPYTTNRTAAVTFGGESVSNVQVAVTQKPITVRFNITSPVGEVLIPGDSTKAIFVVSSNIEFKVSNSGSWMTLQSTIKQGETYALTYTITPNISSSINIDSVVFKRTFDDSKLGTIKVTQWVTGGSFISDSLALLALYKATDGANWTEVLRWDLTKSMRNYNIGTGKYTWNTPAYNGITYNNTFNRVTAVNIGKRIPGGYIPKEIGLLSELTNLSLQQNNLEGTIPEEICNLTKLTTLSLHTNKLTGTIPSNIGNLSLVANFNLQTNRLSGTIPKSIGGLVAALTINLSNNQLEGNIPDELCQLTTKLTSIDFRGNLLTSIPPNIGNCVKLTSIHLEANKLTGSIPTSICSLPALVELWLSENKLTGGIPEFESMPKLTTLYLNDNPQLGGTIPSSLCSITTLQLLNLQNCNLLGTIPADIGNLIKLQSFTLRKNPSLGGDLPASMASLSVTSMNYFLLDSCGFSGSLEPLKTMKFIGVVNLTSNKFTGSIPAELGTMQITNLLVDHNQLTGSIPSTFNTLSVVTRLQSILFGYNKLSGEIPEMLLSKFQNQSQNGFCPQEGSGFSNYTCP